jgi:hypothetical protein
MPPYYTHLDYPAAVPEGRLLIARRFNAGYAPAKTRVP